jgi:hypothetical protein
MSKVFFIVVSGIPRVLNCGGFNPELPIIYERDDVCNKRILLLIIGNNIGFAVTIFRRQDHLRCSKLDAIEFLGRPLPVG